MVRERCRLLSNIYMTPTSLIPITIIHRYTKKLQTRYIKGIVQAIPARHSQITSYIYSPEMLSIRGSRAKAEKFFNIIYKYLGGQYKELVIH